MEEQNKDLELYVPKSPLDSNVKRMAWLLFLEWWKDAVQDGGMGNTGAETMATAYKVSLECAKVVWHEQERDY